MLQRHQVQVDKILILVKVVQEKITLANGQTSYISYNRGKFLGKGGFAKCYELTYLEGQKGENSQSDGKIYAVKVVPKASLNRSKARQKLTSEIKIHKSLQNTSVVKFQKYFEDKEFVYLMLEMCNNQTLNELVRRRKKITELESQSYIFQLVTGVKYLHSQRVIHRDLKLGNLFLNERMQIRIGDFGLAARVLFEGERKRTICGTPNYIAPEILDSKNGHSYEVDFWSIGVILYTMLFGRPPFESAEVKNTYRKIKCCQYSFPELTSISDDAKDFIRRCLRIDPCQRMNLTEMLDHDFLTKNLIPDSLPISTLVCPPTSTFHKSYMRPSMSNAVSPRLHVPTIQLGPAAGEHLPTEEVLSTGRDHGRLNLLDSERTPLGSSSRGTFDKKGTLQSPINLGSLMSSPPFSQGSNGFTSSRTASSKVFDLPVHQLTMKKATSSQVPSFKKALSPTSLGTSPREKQNFLMSQKCLISSNVLNPEKENSQRPDHQKPRPSTSKTMASERIDLKHGPFSSGQDGAQNLAKIEYTNAASMEVSKIMYNMSEPNEIVTKFVDFSSKYGMGYKLSNGTYGVLFNDSTKIVLDSNQFHFDYFQRTQDSNEEKVTHLDFFSYPKEINKKVVLLQHFKSYLDGNQKFKPLDFQFSSETKPAKRNIGGMPFLKKWKRAKKAVLFRLSNKIIQVLFQDGSELFLSSTNGMVTFITSKLQVKKLPLTSDLESKDPSMYKRLQYAKEILIQMINKPPLLESLTTKTHRMTTSDLAITPQVRCNLLSPSSLGNAGQLTARNYESDKRVSDFEKRIETLKGSTLKYSNMMHSNFSSMANLKIRGSRESSAQRM